MIRVYCQACGTRRNVRRASVGTVQRCTACGSRGLVSYTAGFPHGWHLLFTVVSFGLWVPVWVLHYLWARS